jgi:hypothetical protein
MTTTLDDVRTVHTAIEDVSKLTGPDGAQTVAALIEEAQQLHSRWLNVARARMLSDSKFIDGVSMRTLATQLNKSPNAISLWIKDYGPRQYVSVHQDGSNAVDGPTYEIKLIPPKDVRELIAAGRRVAPATLGLYDNEDGLLYEGSAQDLWHQLASQA